MSNRPHIILFLSLIMLDLLVIVGILLKGQANFKAVFDSLFK